MANNFSLNIIFLCILFFINGCSNDEENILKNSFDIFENQNLLIVKKNSDIQNIQLDEVIDNTSILNSKSYNLSNSLIDFPLKKIWSTNTHQSLNDDTPFLSEPIFILSKIYLINSNGNLIKINSEDGEVIWSKRIFKNSDNAIIGPPAISGKFINKNDITIFLHTGSDELFSINAITGNINWKKKYSLPFRGGLTLSQNRLFVSDYMGDFFAIDSNNGNTLWKKSLGTDYNSVYTTARPIVANDKIIVPGTSGSFFVLSFKNGKMQWTENISSNSQLPKLFHAGDIVANPIYSNGLIYLVSQSGFTSAFDLKTSEKKWSLPVGGIETPIISGEIIFINGNMGNLVAINRITGNILWHKKYESRVNVNSYFSNEAMAIYKGPTLADSKLLFSDHHGNLSILDTLNGNELNNLSIGKLAIAPFIANKKVFFLRSDGELLAYE